MFLLTALLSCLAVAVPAQQPAPFETTLAVADMAGKQAVIDTDRGTIVVDLLPEAAPNHVGLFIKLAQEGEYDGTIFHQMVKHGIIVGGDPLTKDPARADVYGRGGLGLLEAEFSEEKHTRGTVSAVLVPGQPNSAGAQFFICVVDQPGLDGQHTVFGRVSEGINVVTAISETPVDGNGRALERVAIRSVTIRDAPPPEPEPLSTVADSDLGGYRVVLETDAGPITVALLADKAPRHVRHFLRLAHGGVFDGTAFHRVVKDFVIQTGWLPSRSAPLDERQQRLVPAAIEPEFNDTSHVAGVVSMARGDDPSSASTSFFIVTGSRPELDGKYTAFGRVIDGMSVVEAIEAMPVNGEAPVSRIEIKRVTVEAP